jgi:hypothetical protein
MIKAKCESAYRVSKTGLLWQPIPIAMILLTILSGCDLFGTNEGPTPGPTREVTAEPSPLALSPLGKRDAPPEGVKGQFEYFSIGDGLCLGLDESKAAVVIEDPDVEVATSSFICFPGFDPNKNIDVQTQLPDGTTRDNVVEKTEEPGVTGFYENVGYLQWIAAVGDPLGKHTVTATQGSASAQGSFRVVQPADPRILFTGPTSGPPGTTFTASLAGFPKSTEIPIYLYRSDPDSLLWQFVTTLPVRTDPQGQAILEIESQAQDPPGMYCLVNRGPKAAPDYVCNLVFDVS